MDSRLQSLTLSNDIFLSLPHLLFLLLEDVAVPGSYGYQNHFHFFLFSVG